MSNPAEAKTASSVGLGTCCLKGQASEDQVYEGLKIGYRLLDTASHYETRQHLGVSELRREDSPAANAKRRAETWRVLEEAKAAQQAPSIGVANFTRLLNDRLLTGIAAKYQRSVAQVVLQWLLQQDITPIAFSGSPKNMMENFAVKDFSLTSQEMDRISFLDRGPNARVGFDPNLIA
eukprot:g31574.t1